jgi:O-methyltransferase
MGLAAWRPLILDEGDFRKCVGGAIDRLAEVSGSREIGDYLEFGVSRGTSMACVHMTLAERGLGHTRLVGFDSFEGLPPEAAEEGWKPGAYASTIAATRRYLSRRGVPRDRVELTKGWFDDTLTPKTRERLGIRNSGLAMYDCDTYAGTKRALEFTLPVLAEHSVAIFDDWVGRERKNAIGQREAFEECVVAKGGFNVEPLPSYGLSRIFLLSRVPD